VHVRLLGPVDVVTGGGPREVPGLRRKAVLAVLALHAGEIVSTDRLIDIVWGEQGRSAGVNTVQSHVSALRRALGVRSAIIARPPGYVLELAGEATDVAAAERLIRASCQASDPARSAALLRSALALWRGRPLLDVAEVPWLAEQSDRLAAMELEAQRALADARMALGEHLQLLPELRHLAAQHPFDEQVHGQLVLAMYRAGRQADALAALRDLRGHLAMELGIDPGPALRELEAGILRQDAALAPPVRGLFAFQDQCRHRPVGRRRRRPGSTRRRPGCPGR
jgi:DNA-binding SARP family transcriptional activator